jgi:integrase
MASKGRIFKRGKKVWIAYFATVQGRSTEVRESGGTSEKDARALLQTRLLAVAAHRRGLTHFDPGRERVTLLGLVSEVLGAMRLVGRVSVRSDTSRAQHLEQFFGTTRAASITSDGIANYVEWRREAGASDTSIDHELSIVRRAFNRDGAPPGPAIPLLQSRHANARRGFVTDAQFKTLLAALPATESDFRDLLEWFFETGMRPSEIARLHWEDLDGDTLRLAAADAKTGHGRTVPVGAGALAAIIKRRVRAKQGDNIFHLGGRFATAGCGGFPKREMGIWHVAAKAAGLPDARPYDLRRSAIRTLVRAGVSEHVAMSISGHRSRATLDRYNITDERDLRDAFRKVATFKHGQKHGQAR